MKYAQAISSIIAPSFLAPFVQQQYGFSNPVTCQVIKTTINHSYLISSGKEKYVLRVYCKDWKTRLEIEEELNLLIYLNENGLKVAFPIKDKAGTYMQKINAIEGVRWAVLFSYAEGQSIRIPSERACFALGQTLARYHQLTQDKKLDRKTYTAESLVVWALKLVESHFPHAQADLHFFRQAAHLIQTQLDQIDPTKVRHGIVHLDIWYANMKIIEETEITLFDFDNCGNGGFFLDLGYTLLLLFRNEPNMTAFHSKRAHFLNGYTALLPISDLELRLIPFGGLAIWLHYAGIHVYRFDDLSNVFLSELFFQHWLNTARKWANYHQLGIESL